MILSLAECATLDGPIKMLQWSAENWASLPMVYIVKLHLAIANFYHNTWISSLNSCSQLTYGVPIQWSSLGSSVCPIFSVLRL